MSSFPPFSAINFHIKRQPCCDKDSRCGIEFVSVYCNNLLWKLHLLILLSAFTQNFILTGCSCEAADTYHLYRWHHNGAKLHCLFISLTHTRSHSLPKRLCYITSIVSFRLPFHNSDDSGLPVRVAYTQYIHTIYSVMRDVYIYIMRVTIFNLWVDSTWSLLELVDTKLERRWYRGVCVYVQSRNEEHPEFTQILSSFLAHPVHAQASYREWGIQNTNHHKYCVK